MEMNNRGSQIFPVTVPLNTDIPTVNFYVVAGEDGVTLIDAGLDTEEAWEKLKRTLRGIGRDISDIERILLTHHHIDHVGLTDRIASRGKALVYAHPEALPRLRRDKDFLQKRADFFEKLYREAGCDDAGMKQAEILRRKIDENEHLKIHADIVPITETGACGLGWQVLETPGHAPDHVVFYHPGQKLLFSGDHVLPDVLSNALVEPDREGNSLHSLTLHRQSFMKCMDLPVDTVFPGHGQPFHDLKEVIRRHLHGIEERIAKVKSAISERPKTAWEIAQLLYPDKCFSAFTLVMSRVVGMLEELERRAEAEKEWAHHCWKYRAV